MACCGQQPRMSELVGPPTFAVGPPTFAVCPPGQCVIKKDFGPVKLVDRVQISHDSILLTFELPDKAKPLGLSTCACLLCRFTPEGEKEPVVRPYTPVSTNAMVGHFQLVVKVYDLGKMSQHLNALPLGSDVDFKHIDLNVKRPYPFGRKHLTMLAGGTGITPMIQALHAILGNKDDGTQVSLIFGNKTPDDILCKDLLERWVATSDGRLRVTHVLSRTGQSDNWKGSKGYISRELIEKHSAPPSADLLIMVCGPPPMYNALCGPRDQKELTGLLLEMGYNSARVVKF